MQPIQRTSCRDRQPSPAAYLAAIIDRRARNHGLSAATPGDIPERFGTRLQRPDASVLIWVEGDAEMARDPAAARHRGLIVVAHGSGHGTTEGSFIISYPVDTEDGGQHVAAVSGVLEAMGWSVLASPRGRTAAGHVNTAVLVSNAHPGPERRLWLAEPVGATPDPSALAQAMALGSSAALERCQPDCGRADALASPWAAAGYVGPPGSLRDAGRVGAAPADGGVRTRERRDQLEARVDEGSAGDDVAS